MRRYQGRALSRRSVPLRGDLLARTRRRNLQGISRLRPNRASGILRTHGLDSTAGFDRRPFRPGIRTDGAATNPQSLPLLLRVSTSSPCRAGHLGAAVQTGKLPEASFRDVILMRVGASRRFRQVVTGAADGRPELRVASARRDDEAHLGGRRVSVLAIAAAGRLRAVLVAKSPRRFRTCGKRSPLAG